MFSPAARTHLLTALASVLAVLWLGDVPLLGAKDEAQDWLEALDVGGRAIIMSLTLTVVGIIIVYMFVGRGIRDFFAAMFCFGFVLFQNKDIFENPQAKLDERWTNLTNGKPDDVMVLSIFFLIIGFFFLVRTLIVVLEQKDNEV